MATKPTTAVTAPKLTIAEIASMSRAEREALLGTVKTETPDVAALAEQAVNRTVVAVGTAAGVATKIATGAPSAFMLAFRQARE